MNLNQVILAYINGIGSRENGRPIIPFYSLFIIFGFLIALLISNYRAHKDGFDWSFFSSYLVIPIFFSAIIGCRLWYVIASFDQYASEFNEGFWHGIWNIINIANGGLAVQGGVSLAVIVGVILCLKYRKGISILKITDYIVPTTFIGQAIGRWGNFFNQEVFGHAIEPSAWSFLPSFITNNMQNDGLRLLSGVRIPDGSIVAPLFIVEGVLNILMFIIVALALPKMNKYYKNGDSTFSYFIGYGIIRLILEDLRYPVFIMGNNENVQNSSSMAVIFIVIGFMLIIFNHIEGNKVSKIQNNLVLLRSKKDE